MKYERIIRAKFIERENWFVARVELAGEDSAGINGVEILAYDCKVTPDSLIINKQITFRL